MNIQILDSWLREHLRTDAKPKEIAEKLSLTSVSIERVERHGDDFLYDIEITTNRPDLASVVGLAREAAAVLPQFSIKAEFIPPELPVIASEQRERGNLEIASSQAPRNNKRLPLEIINDPQLVNRICAVVMEVSIKKSPKYMQERLEAAGIRSLNNLIDVTNYVMRTIGHPAHVFDYDRINPKKIVVREGKKGEKIVTLDNKEHTLQGGDIVADNGDGEIIDLLGIMGLKNSVVTEETKRIVFFIDNNDHVRMRNTSMSLGIRSEAVQMNEKGIDPELAYDALLYGIKMYKEVADGTIISDIIDIYPNTPKTRKITVPQEKINAVIGITIPIAKAEKILTSLGFPTIATEEKLTVEVPSFRLNDVTGQEDIIEEIARVYGYHNLPSILPPVTALAIKQVTDDEYFWEKRVKNALKYWGYTEVYTYSMVSANLFEGQLDSALAIKNVLSEEWEYMRVSLVPSLLEVIAGNKRKSRIHIFEIANVYEKVAGDLPREKRRLAGVVKKQNVSFFEVKGLLEQLAADLGIYPLTFTSLDLGSREIEILIGNKKLGEVEILDDDLIDFELDFETLIEHATNKKIYKPIAKYPPIIEDLSLIVGEEIPTEKLVNTIRDADKLIVEVSLIDRYKDSRTFHILYQHPEKNLTTGEITKVREKIIRILKEKYSARLKE